MNKVLDDQKKPWVRTETFLIGVTASIVASVVFLLIFGDLSEYYKLKLIAIYGSLILALFIAVYLVLVRIKEALAEIDTNATNAAMMQKSIFEELIGKSRSYVDYFYKQAYNLMIKGRLPDDQVRIWDTEELTRFESNIPSSTLVVIDRPVAISQSVIPSLTEVIKNNTNRGVEYRIIGEVPTELTGFAKVSKIEVNGLNNIQNASLVLPNFGMVLYIVLNVNDINAVDLPNWPILHIPSHTNTPVSREVRIRGFATIPYGVIGAEHAYFAVPLSRVDIEQLARRIWCL